MLAKLFVGTVLVTLVMGSVRVVYGSLTDSDYYIGFFQNNNAGSISLYLTNTGSLNVSFTIEAPGVGYYTSGTISDTGSTVVNLPSSLITGSYNDQNKGIYLNTDSTESDLVVIGQNVYRGYSGGDTFLVLPTVKLCSTDQYTYYGISVSYGSYDNVVLIVGTENDTMMDLTVTQYTYVKTNDTVSYLTKGKQYSLLVNRLQTVYIGSSSDLTGTRIVTDNPVSVFSGHECGYVTSSSYRDCEHLIEQIPPSAYWGKRYYIAPLQGRSAYTIRVLAAYNSTDVIMYCNTTRSSYTINAGNTYSTSSSQYCAIHSNKEILVAQYSYGYRHDWKTGDPMMMLVPATLHYSSEINLSTISSGYNDYINIIVLKEYYQPSMMYRIRGGVKRSLQSQSWNTITFNQVTEAYYTQLSVSNGPVTIMHKTANALMSAVVYGFSNRRGYGHSGGLNNFVVLPTITVPPMSQAITLVSNNQQFSLTCEADGVSSYSWEKQDGNISSSATALYNGNLHFNNLQPWDAGNYRCVAICASTGYTYSNYSVLTVTVSPHIIPHIITHPTDTSAAAPFSGVFTCSAGGYGHLNISWYREDVPHQLIPDKCTVNQTSSPPITTSTLTIPHVTEKDSGKYYCVVWAKKQAAKSRCATLYTSNQPNQPIVRTSTAVVYLDANDRNLSINCMPSDYSFHYKWEKRYGNISYGVQGMYSSQLFLTELVPEDSGEYRCIMSNSTGSIASEYKRILILVSQPVMITQLNSAKVDVCSEVTFKCSASGYGKLDIIWKKLNDELPETSKITGSVSKKEVTSFLKITDMVWYYKGTYYCTVKNSAGEVNSTMAQLKISVPCPKMIRPPKPVNVRPGKTAIFYCLAWSFGGLVYDWQRNYKALPSNVVKSFKKWTSPDDTSFSTMLYELHIPNVQEFYEDNYCCIALNECGRKISSCAWLEVNNIPIITKHPLSKKFRNRDKTVTTLTCEATGPGVITYQWEKYQSTNNLWIKISSRTVNSKSPNLTFSLITEEDEGVYRCNISNYDGSVISGNATITVYDQPVITFITNTTVLFEGRKVILSCNVTNDPDAVANSLQVYWYNPKGLQLKTDKDDGILVYSNRDRNTGQVQSALVFDSVNRSKTGTYACRAYNDPESYSEENTTLTVEYAPIVNIDPPESSHTVTVGTRLRLVCTATGQPIPLVQWFRDKHPATPIAQPFQQLLPVPTASPYENRVYTCVGRSNAGNRQNIVHQKVTITVKAMACPHVKAPKNGRVYIVDNGNTAIFICNQKFQLVGNIQAFCVDGKWSPLTPPTCQLQ